MQESMRGAPVWPASRLDPRPLLARLRAVDGWLAAVAVAMVVAAAVLAVAVVVDSTRITGQRAFLKPLHFAFSMAAYAFTLL